MNEELQMAMAGWVMSLAKWKVFFTLSFAYESSSWSAERVLVRFMAESLPTVSYFYAIELHPGGHGAHVHGIWDSEEAPRKATHREWLKRYGRNRIEPIRGLADVVKYCGKLYLMKDAVMWNFKLSRSCLTSYLSQHGNASPTRGAGLPGRTDSAPLELFQL